ncbi:hypothetical protein [Pseudomonas sp. LB3P38]|uniref:hypothetical protein n=1 Tax=Pseudomonas lyxosi TaxID=3398358 RepID=UPI0039EE1B52
MLNIFWRLVAKLLDRPAVAAWLIARAQRTPYQHIMPADGTEMVFWSTALRSLGAPTRERTIEEVFQSERSQK